MNVNVESHFSEAPATINIPRSQFDRSSSVKTTFNVGELIPFFLEEVLPGDTFNVSTSKVVRLQTLLKPVMDNLYLDTYYFFVPNRLIWEHWQAFCGESDKAWTPSVEYSIPQLSSPQWIDESGETPVLYYGWEPCTLADYLGVPTLTKANVSWTINALPFRAYTKVCDDWFRDQNLRDPLLLLTGDGTAIGGTSGYEPVYGVGVYPVNKYHDYFTSCLPAPQRGPNVNIGLDNLLYPVFAHSDLVHTADELATGAGTVGLSPALAWTNVVYDSVERKYVKENTTNVTYRNTTAGSDAMYSGTEVYPDPIYQNTVPSNLWADLRTFGISVNDLRMSFQIQKYYERLARGGSRYIEILKSMFGVTSPDARLQRSEYLGGNRIPINIHEVTNNSEGESGFLGNLGAFSHTVDSNADFIKSFTEHGYIIGVCCARYDHSYPQGLNRLWSRKTKFDYYWPVFANIGEQPVYKSEICFDGSNEEQVFGYQEAWADYRYKPNIVTGEMRPNHPTSLASWNFADDYASVPSLSGAWMEEEKANVDRTLAVTSDVSNQILLDCYIQNYCSRAMPVYSIPGLIDHN